MFLSFESTESGGHLYDTEVTPAKLAALAKSSLLDFRLPVALATNKKQAIRLDCISLSFLVRREDAVGVDTSDHNAASCDDELAGHAGALGPTQRTSAFAVLGLSIGLGSRERSHHPTSYAHWGHHRAPTRALLG